MTTQLNDLLIDQELKIIDAMELIGKTSARILIIVDKNKRLIGTLTDGDIRRAIIDNVDMESPVSKVMRKDPVSANYNSSKNELISLMSDKNLLAIPIVDENGKVRGLEPLLDCGQGLLRLVLGRRPDVADAGPGRLLVELVHARRALARLLQHEDVLQRAERLHRLRRLLDVLGSHGSQEGGAFNIRLLAHQHPEMVMLFGLARRTAQRANRRKHRYFTSAGRTWPASSAPDPPRSAPACPAGPRRPGPAQAPCRGSACRPERTRPQRSRR